MAGYFGDNCEFKCDSCNGDPCYNGGLCQMDGLGYTCQCKSGEFFLKLNILVAKIGITAHIKR